MGLMALVMIASACSSTPAVGTEAPIQTVLATSEPVPVSTATEQPLTPAATESLPAQTEPATEAAAPTVVGDPLATPAGSGVSAEEVIYRFIPGESSVTYEVGETFLDQNRFSVAVGVTSAVNGEIILDLSNPQAVKVGEITVDISQLASDSPRRDSTLRQRFLLSSQFPIARFVTTQVEGLPATYVAGEEIAFKVTGDLTIRDISRPVTFDVTAKVEGGQLSGAAVGVVKMSDYGVGPISMAILRTEDDVKLTVNFVARP
jgi:polyisoprenoid-binding protein YceI